MLIARILFRDILFHVYFVLIPVGLALFIFNIASKKRAIVQNVMLIACGLISVGLFVMDDFIAQEFFARSLYIHYFLLSCMEVFSLFICCMLFWRKIGLTDSRFRLLLIFLSLLLNFLIFPHSWAVADSVYRAISLNFTRHKLFTDALNMFVESMNGKNPYTLSERIIMTAMKIAANFLTISLTCMIIWFPDWLIRKMVRKRRKNTCAPALAEEIAKLPE